MANPHIASARTLAAQINAACEVMEQADRAEEQVKALEQRGADAQRKLEEIEAAHALALLQQQTAIGKATADLEAKEKASEEVLAAHKRKHDAVEETANHKIALAGERLSELNREVADITAKRDAANAELAKVRAALAELAAKV